MDRLDVFRWEWLNDYGDDDDRRWIRAKGKPITLERGISTAGLAEAAEDVLRCVQARLYEFHLRRQPLDMERSAVELWTARRIAIDALRHLGWNELAKATEARVSPHSQALAICIGSAKPELVEVDLHGRIQRIEMAGYVGCLLTFPDAPYGPGRRWPRLCPPCRLRRSNARNKAIGELQRRALGFSRAARERSRARRSPQT